jgi:hypothetical protein
LKPRLWPNPLFHFFHFHFLLLHFEFNFIWFPMRLKAK